MIKVLKKICGILGYKLLPKNYIKNKNYLAGFSSLTLEKFLSNLVEKKIRPIIIFEWSHIEYSQLESTLNLVINNNYSFFPLGDDIVCFHSKKNILLKIN